MNFEKFYIQVLFIFTIFFAIPFNTFASDGDNPILGVNFRIINYEYDETVKEFRESCSSSQSTGTFTSNGNVTVYHNGYYTYNGSSTEPIYSTNSPITGTFSLNGSSSCSLKASNTNTNHRTLIEYDIVLNDEYIGNIDFTINGFNYKKYVNGSHVTGTINAYGNFSDFVSYPFTINSFTLSLANLSYSFPSESLVAVTRFNKSPSSFKSIGDWVYPIYTFKAGEVIDLFEYPIFFCFYIDKSVYDLDKLKEWFDIDGTIVNSFYNNSASWSFVQLEWSTSMKFTCKVDVQIIPIYFNYTYFNNISTDFALKFNLSNSLLSNIDKIANGTSNSNSSSSLLDNTNKDFKDKTSQVENIENQYSQGLDNNLNNIDTNYDFNVYGGGSYFNNSIKWVNDQFNFMTSKTPFGTLLGFSLILGISLLVIGRILK